MCLSEVWNLRGHHNQKKIKEKQTNKNPKNMCLTTITSGDRNVAQMLTSTNREWGLDRKFIGRDHGGE